jgi:hypothetical protein
METHLSIPCRNFTALIGNNDLKPDVKYKARIGATDFDFLVFEVKRPSSIAEDALFKVSIELQLMINRILKENIKQPVVYGVVVKCVAINGILLKGERFSNSSK